MVTIFSEETERYLSLAEDDDATAATLDLAAAFTDLIDQQTGPIGRVVGSEREPAGAHTFCIWASESAISLDVGHIVVAFSEEAAVIGVVDEPRRFSDLPSFLDDFFDRHAEQELSVAPGTLRPEILVFTVNVLATKHLRDDVDSHRPPVSGSVWFATTTAIEFALGRDDYSGIPIPALMHTNGNAARDATGAERRDALGNITFQRAPIWLDGDYLLGPEAGHANWTGQSGLATKTSHALFLTSAVFQKMRDEGQKVAALMFNVKGPDLLWLDKPASPDPADPDLTAAYRQAKVKGLSHEALAAYAALDLEPRPFETFRVFAPFKPNQTPEKPGDVSVTLDHKRFGTALNTQRTAPGQTEGIVFPILWPLETLLKQPHKMFDHVDFDDKLAGFVFELRASNIATMNELDKKFEEIAGFFEADPAASSWHDHHKYTIQKARNRFGSLPAKFGGLLSRAHVNYGALPRVDDPFADQELRVVDIANCNTNVQELIVDAVIRNVWRLAEQEKLGVDKVIIFVDELNKYAPGGGQGGLRDTLVDIAARGRHLNVVLFGAQQFRSKVDDEILGNCGTSLYGRVGDEEITDAAYRSLSGTVKSELLGLRKGRLLVRHAHFRAPLFGTFPYPPTIPGMAGQRIFNPEGNASRPGSHPSDGLFAILQHHMGKAAPAKSEVRTAADSLDPRDLEKLAADIDRQARDPHRHSQFDPWRAASKVIAMLRKRV